jgi:hypothetical protein
MTVRQTDELTEQLRVAIESLLAEQQNAYSSEASEEAGASVHA